MPVIFSKYCELPSCGKEFSKRPDEDYSNFERRRTCCTEHGRILKGMVHHMRAEEGNHATFVSPFEATCTNCIRAGEDEATDEFCSRCTGQFFHPRKKTAPEPIPHVAVTYQPSRLRTERRIEEWP